MEQVAHAADGLGAEGQAFVQAVARNAYKLMAYKDEFEVARLYSEPSFRQALDNQFAGTGRLSLYLAPPLLSRTDPRTGRPAKRKFGPWIFPVLVLLAKGRRLRRGWADPFGRTAERRAERAIRDAYLETIAMLCGQLNDAMLADATAIADLPAIVLGYGPVKEEAMARYDRERTALLARFQADASMRRTA